MTFRLAFPAIACLAGFAMFAACGDNDDAAPADIAEGGLIDSFLADSSVDVAVPTAFVNASLTLVNAAHDLGGNGNTTVRLCFATGADLETLDVPSLAPTPRYVMSRSASGLPGIDQGRGVTLPDIAIPLAERVLTPIIITSRAVENTGSPTCDRLVGPTREMSFELQENIDYWVFPPIAPFTFQPQHAYVLALTGCSSNAPTPNPGKCGPGFVAGESDLGNLALRVFEPAAPPGAQFLHLSSAANAYFFQSDERSNIEPNFGAPFIAFAGIDPPLYALSPLVSAPVGSEQFVAFGKQSFDAGNALSSAFSEVAAASGREGASYETGGSYVFIAVGDPDLAETPKNVLVPAGDAGAMVVAPNSRYFHFLGFPSLP